MRVRSLHLALIFIRRLILYFRLFIIPEDKYFMPIFPQRGERAGCTTTDAGFPDRISDRN